MANNPKSRLLEVLADYGAEVKALVDVNKLEELPKLTKQAEVKIVHLVASQIKAEILSNLITDSEYGFDYMPVRNFDGSECEEWHSLWQKWGVKEGASDERSTEKG